MENRFDVDFFRNPERVRPTVVYKLIHYEKNKELLKEIPHLPFLDLAVVFYCLLTDTPVGHATVLIHNSHLELWGKNTSWLYKAARENTERLLPGKLVSMEDMTFSTRKGNAVYLEDVLNASIEKTLEIIKQKSPNLETRRRLRGRSASGHSFSACFITAG